MTWCWLYISTSKLPIFKNTTHFQQSEYGIQQQRGREDLTTWKFQKIYEIVCKKLKKVSLWWNYGAQHFILFHFSIWLFSIYLTDWIISLRTGQNYSLSVRLDWQAEKLVSSPEKIFNDQYKYIQVNVLYTIYIKYYGV
jgi:hypothetical protein